MDKRMRNAFEAFSTWTRENHVQHLGISFLCLWRRLTFGVLVKPRHSQPMFKSTFLGRGGKEKFPELHAKGYNVSRLQTLGL